MNRQHCRGSKEAISASFPSKQSDMRVEHEKVFVHLSFLIGFLSSLGCIEWKKGLESTYNFQRNLERERGRILCTLVFVAYCESCRHLVGVKKLKQDVKFIAGNKEKGRVVVTYVGL